MQGYHFVPFYLPVFVNPVGLVELEGCCGEGKKKKAQATCWPENSLVGRAGSKPPLAFIPRQWGQSPGLWKGY